MIPVNYAKVFRSIVGIAFVPGQLQACCFPKPVAASVAIANSVARPEVTGTPGIEIDTVDIVISHDVLHHIEIRLAVRGIPTHRSLILADEHMTSRRTSARRGVLRV